MKKNNFRKSRRNGKRTTKQQFVGGLTSVNVNRASLSSKQPVPDRFFTTLSLANTGHFASSAGATDDFAFYLNALVTPFNTSPSLPNAVISVTTAQPAALKNLLFNAGTSTGLYQYFRVWKARVMVNFSPQAVGDTMNLILAPSVVNGSLYSNAIQAMQGPNSAVKVVSSANNQAQNSIRKVYDIPAMLGLSKQEYAAFNLTYCGDYNTGPSNAVTLGVYYQTQDNATNSTSIGISVTVEYEVEFFQRVDSGLLDTLKENSNKSNCINSSNNTNNNNCNSVDGTEKLRLVLRDYFSTTNSNASTN